MANVRRSDLFILILGKAITEPVEREWAEASQRRMRRLVFVKQGVGRTPQAESWLRSQVDVKYAPFQEASDLRESVRAAVIDEIVKGYRQFALQREDYRRLAANIRSAAISFVVRTVRGEELEDISAEFPQLAELYPELDEWMASKRAEIIAGRAEAFVAQYQDDAAGFSLVSEKGAGVRKISTLYIKPTHQGLGVGPRLLYDVMLKAAEDGCEKLYLTVSDERREELAPLLSHYGFHIEGVSGRRYRPGSAEWVWGKRLIHGALELEQLSDFVRIHLLEERGFETAKASDNLLFARRRAGALGFPEVDQRPIVVAIEGTDGPGACYTRARDLAESQGFRILFVGQTAPRGTRPGDLCLDSYNLETMFFPLYFRGRADGLIVAIRQQFARNLIPASHEQQLFAPTRIQLRTDNVYYLFPRLVDMVKRGTPLFFYETHQVSGQSRLVGEAKVVEAVTDTPEELFAKFGNLGVYTLEQLERTARSTAGRFAAKAFAIKFDWYREAKEPLTLRVLNSLLPTYNPTTARRISAHDVNKLRRACGWNVNELSFL